MPDNPTPPPPPTLQEALETMHETETLLANCIRQVAEATQRQYEDADDGQKDGQ